MKSQYLILASIIVGGLLTIQGVLNSQLGRMLPHPLQASFISFLVGAAAITLVVLVSNIGVPKIGTLTGIPWQLYIGGVLGVVYVTAVLLFVPKLGAANVILAVFAGQILMSLLIDHFGLFGVSQISLNLQRVIGCCMMFGGLYVIQLRA